MSLASHPPASRPTPSSTADAAESRWMLRKGLGLAVTSIVGLLLLTVGLEVLSGLIAVPSDVGQFALGIWLVGLALVVILLALPTEDAERSETQRSN